MKRNLLLIGASLLAGISYAQPTLTQANNGYASGDVYTLYNTEISGTGDEGAGVSWDFSDISVSTVPNTATISAASAGAHASLFPGSNILFDYGGGEVYYNVSSSALSFTGIYPPGGASYIKYTNPEDWLRYPFTMGDNYTDTWAADVISDGSVIMNRGGSTEVEAVGYGTLILPAGSYSNVLKVKSIQDYADTALGMVVFTYHTELTQWFLEGYHYSVLGHSASTLTEAPTTMVAIPDPTSMGTVITMEELIRFYPNPATDVIRLEHNKTNLARISITDISGKVIYHVEGAAAQTLSEVNIASFPAANYIIHVVTTDGLKAGELFTKK